MEDYARTAVPEEGFKGERSPRSPPRPFALQGRHVSAAHVRRHPSCADRVFIKEALICIRPGCLENWGH